MIPTPVIFHLTMNDQQERQWLSSRIEHYFTDFNGSHHLFDDVNKTIEIMEVLRQLKITNAVIELSHYQARLLTDVIYSVERRWDVKKNCEYLPNNFDHRNIYDQLKTLSHREMP